MVSKKDREKFQKLYKKAYPMRARMAEYVARFIVHIVELLLILFVLCGLYGLFKFIMGVWSWLLMIF